MNFDLPKNIHQVLNTLISNGHKAYIVGGCVRDLLCGKTPHDYDITTSALPQETLSLFEKTIATGLKHGTITVMIDDTPIEVTTFRTESIYTDSRHPESVNFVTDIKDDLARRDFTVNAMCYNENEGLIDIFGGADDIDHKILRAVGDAKTRFTEDALRILRLFRFAATLEFDIAKDTFDAAICCAPLLKNISAERIFCELQKASMGNNTSVIMPLLETNALENYCIGSADLTVIKKLAPRIDLRTFALLNLTSYNLTKTLDNFKCSNSFKDYCIKMNFLVNLGFNSDKISVKKALSYADYNIVCDALLYYQDVLNIDVSRHQMSLNEVIAAKEPYKISHLDVSGKDITALGYSGKQVGEKLDYLLQEVIKNPNINIKEKLLKLICN